jgi:hypothetical protein
MSPEPLSPELMEKNVKTMLDGLGTRTAGSSKVGHTLQLKDGSLWCLDLDIHAATRDELNAAIIARYASITYETLLTPAPEEAWRRFVAGPNAGTWIIKVEHARGRGFRICVRAECP